MIFCSGFFSATNETLEMIKDFRKLDVPDFLKEFKVFDSIPKLKWCGGRLIDNLTEDFNFDIIKMYNEHNIGIFPTLTNLVYKNLDDDLLIKTLTELNKCELNGAVIATPEMYHFIKENFKNIKISQSISTIPPYTRITKELIDELESKYDYICPRQNLYTNKDFYSIINKSKYEILLNNGCAYNCPKYKDHCKMISQITIDIIDKKTTFKNKKLINDVCFYKRSGMKFDCKELIEIGYTTFKFSKRGSLKSVELSENKRNLNLLKKAYEELNA